MKEQGIVGMKAQVVGEEYSHGEVTCAGFDNEVIGGRIGNLAAVEENAFCKETKNKYKWLK